MTTDEQQRAAYAARVAAWEAALDPLNRGRLLGARELLARLNGSERRAARRKLRDLELALGRPKFT